VRERAGAAGGHIRGEPDRPRWTHAAGVAGGAGHHPPGTGLAGAAGGRDLVRAATHDLPGHAARLRLPGPEAARPVGRAGLGRSGLPARAGRRGPGQPRFRGRADPGRAGPGDRAAARGRRRAAAGAGVLAGSPSPGALGERAVGPRVLRRPGRAAAESRGAAGRGPSPAGAAAGGGDRAGDPGQPAPVRGVRRPVADGGALPRPTPRRRAPAVRPLPAGAGRRAGDRPLAGPAADVPGGPGPAPPGSTSR